MHAIDGAFVVSGFAVTKFSFSMLFRPDLTCLLPHVSAPGHDLADLLEETLLCHLLRFAIRTTIPFMTGRPGGLESPVRMMA